MIRTLASVWFLVAACVVASAQSSSTDDCPTITVTDPAGVVMPHEVMVFEVKLTANVPRDVKFHWTINDSVIVGRQGLPKLEARYLRSAWGELIKASVRVDGLPPGCPNVATGYFAVNIHPKAVQLGTIDDPSKTIDDALIKKIGDSLRDNPGSQLYVWMYHASIEKHFRKLKAHLLRQLSATKVDPTRFTIKGSMDGARGAVFWLVVVGAENPAP